MTDQQRILKRQWKWTAQKDAVALALWEGKTYAEINTEYGLSSATIAAWKKEPEFDARLQEYEQISKGEARRILMRGAPKAATKVVDVMEYGNVQHATRLAAAKDILDRIGLKATEKHEHTITPGTAAQLTDEALEAELKKRGLE